MKDASKHRGLCTEVYKKAYQNLMQTQTNSKHKHTPSLSLSLTHRRMRFPFCPELHPLVIFLTGVVSMW